MLNEVFLDIFSLIRRSRVDLSDCISKSYQEKRKLNRAWLFDLITNHEESKLDQVEARVE